MMPSADAAALDALYARIDDARTRLRAIRRDLADLRADLEADPYLSAALAVLDEGRPQDAPLGAFEVRANQDTLSDLLAEAVRLAEDDER